MATAELQSSPESFIARWATAAASERANAQLFLAEMAESKEEHLIPRSLLEANGVKCDNEHNMAVCCAGCNGLKAEHVPPAAHPCWKSRKAYIKECSRFVAECRLKNFQKYKTHVEAVLKKRAGL